MNGYDMHLLWKLWVEGKLLKDLRIVGFGNYK
jgi:hypothetical protein